MRKLRTASIILLATFGVVTAGQASADKAFVVYFAPGTVVLEPDAQDVIRSAADFFNSFCPEQKLEVRAHTDSAGSGADNLQRSIVYGQAVIDGLVVKGVAAERISLHAYGETLPAVAEADENSAGRNRRVTIWFDEAGNAECFGD